MTNQNRKYPTRMHEVLGVEAFEQFQIKEVSGHFFLTAAGQICSNEVGIDNNYLLHAINHGIIRKPRLSEEQADQLKALVTLGYRWLVEERGGTVVAVNHEVKKGEVRWLLTNPRDSDDVVCDVHQSLSVKSLVSWSDPAPLDIVQTLRDAGVEVEG